jgi:D-tyrosyl-tRNA(Tyr) deacylase
VLVSGEVVGEIGEGLLVFVGIQSGDSDADVEYLAGKIAELRVFDAPDTTRHFDRSVVEIGGAILLVSQFTLCADCRKGRRPSFDAAARPDVALELCERLAQAIRERGVRVASGRFQATMTVELVNEGPVTLLLDSRRSF